MSFKVKPYYRDTKTIAKGGDKNEIEKWVTFLSKDVSSDGKGSFTYFAANSVLHQDNFHPRIKARTVKTGLNKGHTSIDLWCYANELSIKSSVVGEERYGKVFFRTKSVLKGTRNDRANFIIDVDNLKGVDTVEKMEEHLKKRGINFYYMITQTSFNNFHVMFLGDKKCVNNNVITNIAMKIADVTDDVYRTPQQFDAELKKNGVDPACLKIDPVHHKFRVPGSTNSKYLHLGGFVVKGRINKDAPKTPLAIYKSLNADVKLLHNKNKEEARSKKFFWRKYHPKLRIILKNVFKKRGTIQEMTEFFAKKIGWLCEDGCGIGVEELADYLGCGKANASKKLKAMVESGVLEIKSDYFFGGTHCKDNKVRTYVLASKFRDFFNKTTDVKEVKKSIQIDLSEEYQPGMTWSHISSDIRKLYSAGIEVDEIVDFVCKKQEITRPVEKWRDRKYLTKWVENWEGKFYSGSNPGYTRPGSPYLNKEDLSEVLSKISEGGYVSEQRWKNQSYAS